MANRNWLSRYLSGDREAVWIEMAAHGQLDGHAHDEAIRVADETMKRARIALEQLADRLRRDGYVFVHPQWVFLPPDETTATRTRELQQKVGPIPVALRSFWEQVGSVDFIGAHPEWPLPAYCDLAGFPNPKSAAPEQLLFADPIVVEAVETILSEYDDEYAPDVESGEIDPEEQPFCFSVAPDALHKANVSGGQQDVAIGLVADPELLGLSTGPMTFVSYLRGALRHAGFAGFVHRRDPNERRGLIEWAERIAKGIEPI
jgi:hypothetical protein